MPIPITCSGCSATMSAPDHFVGKRVSCPKCKTSFVIPDPKAVDDFEVVEDEVLDVAEVIDDEPAAAPPAMPVPKPAMPVAAKVMGAAPANPIAAALAGAAAAATTGKLKKPNPRHKKQVDPSDFRTRVNGKPLALKPGEAMPPTSLPRKSAPRD